MIDIIFIDGQIILLGKEFILQNLSIADETAIDVELAAEDNIWTTSFNIKSVTVNGRIFESSQELLDFFQK